ncbi:MAG: hypothetical protein ACTSRS_21875 [Candidatus Helarchaeota archaeon]
MVTVYCYEKCDSLSNISFDDYFNESIVSSPKKEGSGALKIDNMSNASENSKIVFNAINDAPSGKKVLGFWVRVENRNGDTWIEFKWKDDSSGHYIWLSMACDGSGNPIFKAGVVGGGGSPSYDLGSYSVNTWYWIELEWTNSNSQTIYINGTAKHSWSGFGVNLGENTNFSTSVNTNWNGGITYIDGIRITDETEYPPPAEYAHAPCSISSSSDSLILDARIIDIHIKKSYSPAIYKVVQRDRNVLDSEIYIKNLLTLEFISRLSSSEVETLRTIFGDREATIKLGGWTFNGWFGKRKIVWDYRKESEERPWKVTFTFDVTNYNYEG